MPFNVRGNSGKGLVCREDHAAIHDFETRANLYAKLVWSTIGLLNSES